jgi:predicted Zn-dependent protease
VPRSQRHSSRILISCVAVALAVSVVVPSATTIRPPANRYTTAQDIKLGQQAAAQARGQLPMLRDRQVNAYVQSVGRRLVAALPARLRHSGFRYSFEVVNVRDINAFALPGGPMFVNRGMLSAAQNEGQVAGVMAHELGHVALRHGTAQASKATKYEVGALAGSIIGAIIGGRVGTVVTQGTRFGLGTAFMRFGREYERQADLEGAEIMARAGYDPQDMANMFKIIAQRTGPGGPEWLSDHPNPGNRYESISREARARRVSRPIRVTPAFKAVKAHLESLPPSPTLHARR